MDLESEPLIGLSLPFEQKACGLGEEHLPYAYLGVEREGVEPHGADKGYVSGLERRYNFNAYKRHLITRTYYTLFTCEYITSFSDVIQSPACLESTSTTLKVLRL